MVRYNNKYRIPSARLQGWDYSCNGVYFITICTLNNIHYFGDIINGKMQLSNIGVIADIFLYEIKNHTKNTALNTFVVMPNHIHVILMINKPITNTSVETLHATSLSRRKQNKQMASIAPKSASISTIIRSYKSAVTKHSHRLGYKFSWQSRFHDHIIRNDESFNQITEYITNNPQNWEKDKFHPHNGY